MVSSQHDQPGAQPDFWQTYPPANGLPPLPIPSGSRLLLLAAHPDDETLGAAGLMTEVLARAGDVEAVIVADGENSHPYSPTWTPAALAVERRREVQAALGHLGLTRLVLDELTDPRVTREQPGVEIRRMCTAGSTREVRAGDG